MEDKKVKKWEITAGAAHLISKLIVSCHELSLDKKSAALVCKAVDGGKVCEVDFLQADKMGLYNNLIATAISLRKTIINQEVVIKYFGGKKHEQAALEEVAVEEGRDLPLPLQMFLLVHILIPVKITGRCETGLIGEYANNGKKVTLEGILLFKEDAGKDLNDKIILFHYAPVISAKPDSNLVSYLLKEQGGCKSFMEALDNFNGKTIQISEFSKAIKRTIEKMEL